jgi:arsenate reductase (glutaredoxin)
MLTSLDPLIGQARSHGGTNVFSADSRIHNEMVRLYGIANCDTMKKARRWLDAHGVEYRFHDYKNEGVDETRLRRWVKQVGWESLLNRRGTTWRKLDDAIKAELNQASAIRIMLQNPAIIKRPVMEYGKVLLVGFSAEEYAGQFD